MIKSLFGRFCFLVFTAVLNCGVSNAQYICTFAGGGTGALGDGGQATAATLLSPSGVCTDRYGNIYISDENAFRVRKVSTSGIITTIAGNGTGGYSGDFGPATNAQLNFAEGVAVDTSGGIYIADQNNNVIRKVKYGIIFTIAGNGTLGDSVDGGPATDAHLYHPADVAVDYIGNVYFVDQDNQKVKKVTPSGIITTIAGVGYPGIAGYNGDSIPGNTAKLNWPEGIASDSTGNVYVADRYNNRIRRIDAITGIITTFAGSGVAGYSGDGGPATAAAIYNTSAVGIDKKGNLYITDFYNFRIRKVVTAGIITTIACTDNTFDLSSIAATDNCSRYRRISQGPCNGNLTCRPAML